MGIRLSIRGTAPALRGGAYFMVGLLACVAIGCGDDDDDSAAMSCPADASAGTKISCHCGDSGVGIATCKNDGTIGACMCAGDGGSAGSSSSTGGKSGGGGAGSSGNGGSGGTGGTTASEEDASVSEEDGGQSEQPATPATPIPTNGDQFTACDKDRDCNRNLGCYSPEGGGFCSLACARDEDCAGLKPAGFHCATSGVCALACANADDDASCPSGMQCTPYAAGGGGEFRCLYPVQAPEPTGTAFAACMGGGSCMDGLECSGDNMDNTGFCTHGCTPADSDCSDVVAPSGTIAASCVPQTQNMGTCALNCEAMPAGCPTGMQCVQQGFYQLCLHMN